MSSIKSLKYTICPNKPSIGTVTFNEPMQKRLASLSLFDQNRWIQTYYSVRSEDRENLSKYYVQRINQSQAEVTDLSSRKDMLPFGKMWALCQPLQNKTIGLKLIKRLEKSFSQANSDSIKSLTDNLEANLDGFLLHEDVAIALADTLLKTAIRIARPELNDSSDYTSLASTNIGDITNTFSKLFVYLMPFLEVQKQEGLQLKIVYLSGHLSQLGKIQHLAKYKAGADVLSEMLSIDAALEALSLLTLKEKPLKHDVPTIEF